MKLKQRCKEGHMSTQEFVEFASFKPVARTHLLDAGDYLVTPAVTRPGLDIEMIDELDYLGEHDFRTVKGTVGPISGNIFIKLGETGQDMIMEGNRPYHGPGSVYEAVRILQKITTN